MKEKRMLIEQRTNEIAMQQAYADGLQDDLNTLVTELNDLGEKFTWDEVIQFVKDPQSIEPAIRERALGSEPATINGMKLNRSAMLEMIDISDVQPARAAAARASGTYSLLRGKSHIHFADFELTAEGVQLKNSAKQRIADMYSVYADTEAEKEVFTLLNEIVERYSLLQKNTVHYHLELHLIQAIY